AARARVLAGVDGALGGRAPKPLGRDLHALGQEVAETLAPVDQLEQSVRPLGVAPLQVEAELLAGDVAILDALHHPAAQPAELVDVHAGAVESGVEPGDRDGIGAADRPAGARPALVLGLVHDLAPVRAPGEHLHVAVVHAAGAALMAPVVEA